MSITFKELKDRQSMGLDFKIKLAKIRIREFFEEVGGLCYVSFSGGKDSTVLLHLVRSMYPGTPAVFVDTGLEYPEVRDFVKTVDNVVWLRPKMSFVETVARYGYPIVSKAQACAISRYRNTTDPVQKYRRLNGWPNGKKGMISKKWQHLIKAPFKISDECCNVMKIQPIKKYAKETGRCGLNGVMAGDSRKRKTQYIKTGCNSFDTKEKISRPLGVWLDADIWEYLKIKKVPYSTIYDMGYDRTGCFACGFGLHEETKNTGTNRFVKMSQTHPRLHRHCMCSLGLRGVLDHLNVPCGSSEV